MARIKEQLKKIWNKIRIILKEQECKHPLNLWQQVILHVILSVVVCFAIEWMSRHGFMAAITFVHTHTKAFLYNCLLILLTSLPIFLLKKRIFLRILVFGLWFAGGLTNGVVLANRVTPFTGPDFRNFTEGKAVMGKYLPAFVITLLVVVLVAAALFLLIYIFRSSRYKGKMYYGRTISAIVVFILGFGMLTNHFIDTGVLSTYFGNIAFAYQDYGFPYCFTVTLFDTGISEPNNYSYSMIQDILEEDSETVGETTLDEDVNIIVVQLESFFDPTRVNFLKMSEDPIPNWHRLTEQYSSGYYTVPTIGAGTANTEFETLTGMSLRFFGAGEYPFKSLVNSQVAESSAYILKELGYTTTGFHDNEANFYSRRLVYKNLGFDSFVSEEYMQNQDDVNANGWMRDRNLIQPINEAMDLSEGKDYIFAVSVQPHGAYPTEETLEDPLITVSGDMSEEKKWAWEYYVNELHEEDQFVMDLITSVEARGEKTVILFYGDHLPTMGLAENEVDGANLYQTDYLIWDNIGLSKQDKDITSYQAISYLMERLGIHEGTMFQYQQAHDGTEDNYFTNMQALQYDILYGSRYAYKGNLNRFVVNENYRLGNYPVYMTGVETDETKTQLTIYGKHFTQSCKVLIGKEVVETIFVDENTLLVPYAEVRDGQRIRVGVQSNSSTHKILTYAKNYYKAVGFSEVEETVEPSAEPTPTDEA